MMPELNQIGYEYKFVHFQSSGEDAEEFTCEKDNAFTLKVTLNCLMFFFFQSNMHVLYYGIKTYVVFHCALLIILVFK